MKGKVRLVGSLSSSPSHCILCHYLHRNHHEEAAKKICKSHHMFGSLGCLMRQKSCSRDDDGLYVCQLKLQSKALKKLSCASHRKTVCSLCVGHPLSFIHGFVKRNRWVIKPSNDKSNWWSHPGRKKVFLFDMVVWVCYFIIILFFCVPLCHRSFDWPVPVCFPRPPFSPLKLWPV